MSKETLRNRILNEMVMAEDDMEAMSIYKELIKTGKELSPSLQNMSTKELLDYIKKRLKELRNEQDIIESNN